MYDVEIAVMPTTAGLNSRTAASSAAHGRSCTVQSMTRTSKSLSRYADSAVRDGAGIRPRKNLKISCGGSTSRTRIQILLGKTFPPFWKKVKPKTFNYFKQSLSFGTFL